MSKENGCWQHGQGADDILRWASGWDARAADKGGWQGEIGLVISDTPLPKPQTSITCKEPLRQNT